MGSWRARLLLQGSQVQVRVFTTLPDRSTLLLYFYGSAFFSFLCAPRDAPTNAVSGVLGSTLAALQVWLQRCTLPPWKSFALKPTESPSVLAAWNYAALLSLNL